MAHYFDDVSTKNFNASTPRTPGTPRLRRSSTYGNGPGMSPVNGNSTPHAGMLRRGSATSVSSFQLQDPRRARERDEADTHMHTYITQRLEHLRCDEGSDSINGDDLEAK